MKLTMEEGKIRIERFDGKDFSFWKMQIEDYLHQKKLYQPLDGMKPTSMEEEEWKVLDRQALGIVRLTLGRSVAFNVKDEKTTAGLMKTLSSMYEKPSAVNKVYLMRRLFDLKMNDGGSAAEHMNEFNSILGQLSSVGIDFEDEIRALILLSSLPMSWETVVAAISNSTGKRKLKCDDVRDLILSESTRRKESGVSSGEAHACDNRGRGRQQGGSASHLGRSKSRGPGRSNGAHVLCWGCGGEGHLKRNCPKKKGKAKVQESDGDGEASSVSEYDSDCLYVSSGCSMESWVLDSGSSFHSTPCKELFRRFDSEKLEDVHLANGEHMEVMGSGEVSVKLTNGGLLKLKDVKYIPKLKNNLISVSQLDKCGYKVVFEGGSWRIVKGARIEAHGTMNGTLYTSDSTRVARKRGCGSSKKVSFVETKQVKGTHKDVVRENKAHKVVVCEKQAKGDLFGWEHGRSAQRTRRKSKSLFGVTKGGLSRCEHGKSAWRAKEKSLGLCDGDDPGLDETSVLLPW